MQKLSQTDELAGQLASQARSHLLTEEQVSQAMDQQEYDVSQLDALYEALADRLQAMGILNLYACIGYPQAEDEYLTKNSAQFHEHLGFTLAGTFHNCGYKFGRWYDMIWMEKIIGEHRPDQPDIVPYQY